MVARGCVTHPASRGCAEVEEDKFRDRDTWLGDRREKGKKPGTSQGVRGGPTFESKSKSKSRHWDDAIAADVPFHDGIGH
jgi:hypothetical protein